MTFLARVALVAGLTLTGEFSPAGAQGMEPREFLEALTGEWAVTASVKLGPDQEPVRTESREIARMIGETWLTAESTGEVDGEPFTSILTVGYDPFERRFVATWISGRQAHLWIYTGALDTLQSRLTLETRGPVLGDPERTARYREVIELVGPDTKVMRSLILGPNSEWFEFQRAEYRRDKAAGRIEERMR